MTAPDARATAPDRAHRPRRGPLFWICAAAGVLAAALYAAHLALAAADQRFIEAKTGLPWPRGSQASIKDDGALLHASRIRAHLRIPAAERPGFATRHRLSPIDRQAACSGRLPDAPPAPCPDHRYFERSGDRTGQNPFQLLFDGDTGDLWIVVHYPD